MRTGTIAQNLKASLVAGALAGLLVAAFHFLATEQVVEEAVGREAALGPAEEVFSRTVQRLGLFGGFLLYGVSWGLIFAGVYQLAAGRLPGRQGWQKGLVLAGIALWSVGVFPLLKYPARPPGVGDEGTIEARQAYYLLYTALSVVAAVGALGLAEALQDTVLRAWRWPIVAGAYAAACALIYILMPASPDESLADFADLLGRFQALSLAGLVLFWLALGGAFGPLQLLFAEGEAAGGRPSGPR